MPGDFLKKNPDWMSVPGEAGATPPIDQPPGDTGDKMGDGADAFLALVILVLKKNGVWTSNTPLVNQAPVSEVEQAELALSQEALGFYENIEEVIMDDWNQATSTDPTLPAQQFAHEFAKSFHNVKIERVAPEYIQERNKKLTQAYYGVLETIKSLQSGLDDERLRKRVESDERKNPASRATLHQCDTMFCTLSIGCDQTGVYTLIYSLDYQIHASVPQAFINKFLRRLFELTPGGMEVCVRIGSLRENCVGYMQQLANEAQNCNWHSWHMVPRQEDSAK